MASPRVGGLKLADASAAASPARVQISPSLQTSRRCESNSARYSASNNVHKNARSLNHCSSTLGPSNQATIEPCIRAISSPVDSLTHRPSKSNLLGNSSSFGTAISSLTPPPSAVSAATGVAAVGIGATACGMLLVSSKSSSCFRSEDNTLSSSPPESVSPSCSDTVAVDPSSHVPWLLGPFTCRSISSMPTLISAATSSSGKAIGVAVPAASSVVAASAVGTSLLASAHTSVPTSAPPASRSSANGPPWPF
mmetsp:Transcript_146550/g.365447  ORF Transcript_146550/g.365447 Transcript_146550/m.365447 type:complete len:252 (-) Transcript_146550:1445-2200(-)